MTGWKENSEGVGASFRFNLQRELGEREKEAEGRGGEDGGKEERGKGRDRGERG